MKYIFDCAVNQNLKREFDKIKNLVGDKFKGCSAEFIYEEIKNLITNKNTDIL